MKKIIVILAILVTAASLSAQKTTADKLDRSKRPVPGPAPTIKLGNIQSFELANGLKVFVVENHKAPTVAYSIILDVKPELEKEAVGTATVTSSLITSGTKTRTKDQLDNDIDFIGATLTATPTSLYAASLKKQQGKLLELLSDVTLNADFKQEELDKLKNQTISGLASQKDDPDAIATNVKSVLNFGAEHPYGELTTEESVGKITLEKCNSYYKTYFRPNVSYMAIVGDVTLGEVKPLIEKYFGSWEKAIVPKASHATPAAPLKTRVAVVNKAGAVQSVIHVTYPVQLTPGSEDVIKAKVLNTILGAGFSSRLFMNLREKHGYTYGSYSSLNNDELIGEFSAYAKVRNAVTDSSVIEILNELNRIRQEKVPQDELEGIKNFLTGSFAISLEDPAAVARFAINIDRYKLPKDYYTNYLKNLAAVTSEDVYAMAQKYIHPENATILVVGDKSEISSKLEVFSADKKIEFYDNYGKEAVNLKPAPAGITAKTVIAAYVKAIGGEKALSKVKDISVKRTADSQFGKINMTEMKKAPGKYSMTVNIGAMTVQKMVYDGTKAVQSGMQGKKELLGDELNDLKSESVINQEMNYEKLGYKLQIKGIEPINGSDAYVLEIESPYGKKSTEWYNVASGLKIRASSTTVTEQGPVTQTTGYLDYKEINKIKYPNIVEINGGPLPLKLVIESIEVNKGIKDSEFNAQ
ncbi:MAG: insulinase family protein [Bacteroidota bacterium]|nr:insulinase family protein [Bacteroidota bacterium]